MPDVTPETTLIAPLSRRAEPEPGKESPLVAALQWLHETYGPAGRLAVWGPPASVHRDHVQLPHEGPGTWAVPPEEVLAALRAATPGVQTYGSHALPAKLRDEQTFCLLVS